MYAKKIYSGKLWDVCEKMGREPTLRDIYADIYPGIRTLITVMLCLNMFMSCLNILVDH